MNTVEIGRTRQKLCFDSYAYPTQQFEGSAYESDIVSVLEHFLEPGDCAIDAGASVGFHTLMMAKLVGPEGLVLAFEPHGESYEHLCKHIMSNEMRNIVPFKLALWKRDQRDLALWSIPVLGYSTLLHYDHYECTDTVEGRALDTLVENEHPRLIKIDCEGAEPEILLGAQKMLKRGVDCVIVELNYKILHDMNRTDMLVRDFMAGLGYDMFLINIGTREGGYCPPIKVEPGRRIKLQGEIHWMNVMFSTEEKVRERWQTELPTLSMYESSTK